MLNTTRPFPTQSAELNLALTSPKLCRLAFFGLSEPRLKGALCVGVRSPEDYQCALGNDPHLRVIDGKPEEVRAALSLLAGEKIELPNNVVVGFTKTGRFKEAKFSSGTGLWTRVYSFRGNPLNTLAIDLGDGSLGILSPGTDLGASDFAELDALGSVSALVSPGAFHNMGLPAWSARYPDAGLYGPGSAKGHIAKAHKTLKPLQDFAALAKLLPADVSITEMPDMKHPDCMVIIKRDDAVTWFTNECITNLASLPSNFIFALLFRLTGSTPGLNINKLAMKFVGGKKKSVHDYVLDALESDPPTRLVPCHGDIINDPDLAGRMREMVQRRLG